MIRHILISDLRPGMFIVDQGYAWRERPYLYAQEGLLEGVADVERVASEGYTEAYVDMQRSPFCALSSELTQGVQKLTPSPAELPEPAVALEEELPEALKVHDESVAYTRKLMEEARTGKVDVNRAGALVEGFMRSLERNADALLSLSRLHHTDSYTYTHCVNVSVFSAAFSRFLGGSEADVHAAGMAGLFHDIGKAKIPLHILNAPRRLAPNELRIMERHPTLGAELLYDIPGISEAVFLGAWEHHENHDGSGYPRKLAGDQISLIARMVAVGDIYDALTTDRVYREAMFPHKALGIIYQLRDKEFTAETADLFIRMVGIYPVGSIVELEDGTLAVVTAGNAKSPVRPFITLARGPKGEALPPAVLNLAQDGAPLIKRCIPAEVAGIDPMLYLSPNRAA